MNYTITRHYRRGYRGTECEVIAEMNYHIHLDTDAARVLDALLRERGYDPMLKDDGGYYYNIQHVHLVWEEEPDPVTDEEMFDVLREKQQRLNEMIRLYAPIAKLLAPTVRRRDEAA